MRLESYKKGPVVAIGGAEKSQTLQYVLDACPVLDPLVAVFTSASGVPKKRERDYSQAFIDILGVNNVKFIHARTWEEADHPRSVEIASQAAILFFTGGDQNDLVRRLKGTRLFEAALDNHNNHGAVYAGTSAGAAAMSGCMISGGDPEKGARLDPAALRISSGFNILPGVLIETHRKRGRLERVCNAVMQNPHCIGIALDEDTAAVFSLYDHTLKVAGSGSAAIVDGTHIKDSNSKTALPGACLSASDLKIAFIAASWGYDLDTGVLLPPDGRLDIGGSAPTDAAVTAPERKFPAGF